MKKTSGSNSAVEAGNDRDIEQFAAKYPPLSEGEFQKLFRKYRRKNPYARKKILEGNLRLVWKIAARHIPMGKSAGLDYQDLVEEGSIGLIRALEKYNPKMRTRFSTYATYWIDQSIRRAIKEQAYLIRLPHYIQDRLLKVKKKSRKLSQKLGRDPTLREVAAALRLDDGEVTRLLADTHASQQQRYLENPIDEDGDLLLENVIGDKNLPPELQEQTQRIKQEVRQLLAELPKQDQKLLIWRYGLDNNPPHSLAEIGEKLRVSRERVRQLLERAIRRLRKIMNE